ncbi:PucR family transcriptional regulator [Acetobacterium woodii]|uniref:PucR C-terminal helix-turn-helix domain-containing protein n=1 Tax=Acetobacterium woodii (strain ATCC 29683 / DSM 1030 / JCM 2381 / KCTC 1655 / WB1) TaxID=931626 RepID=H6LB71_ACEWD|nr:PucR family transcriptional regulator [Acetobacterium woodii]AFA47623.1 hypothetical protein Awo_c08320 [Acetobacterium woodii DSM 1030]
MKLNLSIIYDELSSCRCEMRAKEKIDMDLDGFQILPKDNGEALSKNYLYLSDLASFKRVQSVSKAVNFLIYGADSLELLSEPVTCNCLFLKDASLAEALTELSAIFERYQKWDAQLCQALLNQNSVENIFHLCAGFLKNPIAYFDIHYVLIFLAGQLPPDIKNTSWEETVTKGYASIENYQRDESKKVIDFCKKYHQPYAFESSFYGNRETKVVSFLFYGDKILGNLSSTDILTPLTKGQLSLIYHMQKILEKVLSREYAASFWEDSENNLFLSKIIEGFEVRQDVLYHFLAQKNWQNHGFFRLVLFIGQDDTGIEPFTVHHATNNIGRYFKDAMIMTYHNEILAIIHDDSFQIPENLKIYLQKVQLQCAVSFTFFDFLDLRIAYRQCREALASAKAMNLGNPLFFQDQYSKVLLDNLVKNVELRCFCDLRLIDIFEKKNNGIEWIRSLHCYLMAGRNISVAAKMLSVHRNTMSYRIAQVGEMIGCDLAELDEKSAFILNFTCLILMNGFD